MVGRLIRPGHAALLLSTLGAPALAQIVIPGANQGSDGAFNPTGSTYTLDLSLAQSGPGITWESPGGDSAGDADTLGNGVYDPEKWAVVFKFSSINIPAGTTVKFTNHPSNAPVVWLVTGSVTIAGTVNLNGANGHTSGGSIVQSIPGPGGFPGGLVDYSPAGHAGGRGPGGPRTVPGIEGVSFGGSYATVSTGGVGVAGPSYGNASIIPLIGGSGGTGLHRNVPNPNGEGGGAGGGAILIACANSVTLTGSIVANGGNTVGHPTLTGVGSAGSGGAIRIVAESATGTGTLRAMPGTAAGSAVAGTGRIRVEANSNALGDPGNPVIVAAEAGPSATVWPTSTAPTISISLVDGQAAPSDPRAALTFGSTDIAMVNPNPVTIRLSCRNIPVPPLSSQVQLRVIPKVGQDFVSNATFVSGDGGSSIWETTITLPNGAVVMQARAVLP